MALNIISNYAANVAHRNLSTTDRMATDSLTKLSSGTRVVSAKDDAASLAIGARMNAEVQAMRQASVNAGQAGSMLQIADGAYGTIADVLVRMKSLAVQASSGQLSSTERSVLNEEFVALRSEIDRISQDTEFNGTTLINGGTSYTVNDAHNLDGYGISDITFSGVTSGDAFRLSYATAGETMTLTNVNTGEAQIVDITAALDAVAGTGADLDTGEKVDVVFSGLGVTLTLGYGFERGTAITPATVTATNGTTTSFDAGTTVTLETSSITNANVTSLAALSVYNSTTGILTLATTSTTSADVLTVDAVSGLEYSVDGGITWTADNTASADVANGTGNASQLKIRLAGDDQVLATVDFTGIASTTTADTNATIAINIGQGLFGETSASSSSTSFTFKLGTGDQTQDDLTFSVSAASTSALSLSSNTITSAALADTASTAVTTAINTLNTSRAQIGAAQNRLSFASANLATSIENAEAARSELLDLDIASEMSNFTAKQVLMQAGVSMLAQANQIPQNLLRLFQ